MDKIKILAISVIYILSIVLPVSAEFLEVRGRIANETGNDFINLSSNNVKWGPRNFAGFFYDINDSLGNEDLIINQKLNNASRTIKIGNLIYSTIGNNKLLNVVKYAFNNNFTNAKAKGLNGFDAGQMSSKAGNFKVVGWQESKYVALENKTNKLVKPVLEQKEEIKSMTNGTQWLIGKGWRLDVLNINTSSKKIKVALYKDNIKKDERLVSEGWIYTYQQSFSGEKNVPLFLTYLEKINISSPPTVKFRYTWALDTNVTQISVGSKFGVFNTTVANQNEIVLKNFKVITLAKGSTINLMEKMGFRVADKQILRFYPKIDYKTCLVP